MWFEILKREKKPCASKCEQHTFIICATKADDYSLSFVMLTITIRDI